KPRPGTSRMAHLAALRRELDDASEALKEAGEKKEEPKAGAPESRREPLYRLLRGALPAMVYCPTASDVLKAIELSETYKFRMVLVLGRDGWKAAPEIARRKLEAVLAPDFVYWETDPDTHEEVRRVGSEALAKAGVPFALQTDGSALGSSYLWYQAAVAVRHGLPRAEALQAVTLRPARLLGLESRLGSIEKGKDATLVILTGDPLDAQTWVDQVLIEGRPVYERSKDVRLKRLLEGAR
ncbi:MAG TPA: amidohydrolase family protein, partial [Planctomycetota bacterium]|nr:amidohydrolase family protein [Planctomycetota bacterium]